MFRAFLCLLMTAILVVCPLNCTLRLSAQRRSAIRSGRLFLLFDSFGRKLRSGAHKEERSERPREPN